MLLPAQPLSERIATLYAAVAAQTADSRPHLNSRKQQFDAVRHGSVERSLGEIRNGQVQQPVQYSDAYHQQVPLNGTVENQPHTKPLLVQETSADNGVSSGSCVSNVSKNDVIGRTLWYYFYLFN